MVRGTKSPNMISTTGRVPVIAGTGSNSTREAIELTEHAKQSGADGALLYDGRDFIEVPPHPVRAIDSNGAGDMFAGAFLYAITHGHNYASAGRLACRSAAELVCHYGPRLPPDSHRQLLEVAPLKNTA